MAHTKLSHSRAFIVRAYPLQTHEMLFDALTQAFRVLGGVPRRGIFDNMKTAVDRIGSGKARQGNARFAAMASHYLFEPDFCNPASGWEKGQVGKNVQDARRRLWQPLPSFPVLALVLQHDEQAVLCAVELALDAGVPTKTHILNLLHRLVDGKADKVAMIDAPQALVLRREPKADVGRYDALRGKDLRHAS